MATTSSELYSPQNGDFVIQTSDAVLFGVHRLILTLSSPVMSDMFALGAIMAPQSTPGAFLLLPFDETLCLINFFNLTVTISEDSKTFQDLLSFMYPDKSSTLFTSLDALLPVLSAAFKCQMKAIVDALKAQIMSRSINGNIYREALLYDDPLRVYVKAKEFDLGDLVNAAANATLNIDIARAPDTCSDFASMPAMWLWQLLGIRMERADWLMRNCGDTFYIAGSDIQYDYMDLRVSFLAIRCACGAGDASYKQVIPAPLLDKIKAYPCPRAIRKINFHVELKCLRCGAAATAHFNKICKDYEAAFGTF